MIQETTEIQELSLEKVIDTKLVQNNVTDQVLAALKEKYGSLKLTSLEDKESYLELKAAAKDCAKVRNLAVKVCKEGREDAIKVQKLWISKEKEVVGRVVEIEKPLDDQIAAYDAEVERKANEEIKRQEEAYINRQATLTKMGAAYEGGGFALGEVFFEAELVKGASLDVWEESIVPKYVLEYERIEAVRVEAERKRAEEQAEMNRQREELARQQEEFRQQQAELQRQREEMQKAEQAKLLAEKQEADRIAREEEFARRKVEMEKQAEEKRLADIDAAVKKEQERLIAEAKLAEERRLQEDARKAEELAQATDKEKYADLISKIGLIKLPEMRSGQYRRKVASIREHLEAIYNL